MAFSKMVGFDARARFVSAEEQISGAPQVLERELDEQVLVGLARRGLARDLGVVVAARDGLLEDGGVRCPRSLRERRGTDQRRAAGPRARARRTGPRWTCPPRPCARSRRRSRRPRWPSRRWWGSMPALAS